MGSSKTTQKTSQKPTVTPQLQELYDQLNAQVSGIVGTDLQANPFARASDLTQDELNAFQMVRDNIGVGRGTLDAGVEAQLRALGMSGRAPTQDELNQYMNPFTEQVINRSIEKQQEDADRGFLNIGSNAALTNAFGGSRQALLESELARNLNKNIGDTYYTGMKDNYDKSLATYLGQIDRLSENAGRTLQTAGLQQAYGLADAAALEGIGRTQRQRSDIDLGLKSEDFLRLQNEPYKDLEALSMATGAISPGSIGSNSTTVTKQQQSPLQTLMGLGSIAAGALTGGASTAAGALTGGASTAAGIGATGVGSSFGASNLSNFVTNLPFFKGWGSATGGRVPKPKGYAYGGRVGNSWSMGESADVVQATQNPFSNEMQINRGTPGNATVPSILSVNDTAPTAQSASPSFVSPDNNPFATWYNNQAQQWNNTPWVQQYYPEVKEKYGFSLLPGPMNILPVGSPSATPNGLAYNAGAVSPEIQVTPDRGGNPVANLLDQYKSGVRTGGSGLAPQSLDVMPIDSIARPATFGSFRNREKYAKGGAVTLNNSNIPPITPVNPLSVALYFAEGGMVPGYADGGKVPGYAEDGMAAPVAKKSPMDILFSPEGLMMLGLNILGSDASNPFQALGQAGLATLGGMQEQQVNPLDQLKLEYQQLRNQDVQARMDDRLADNSRAEEQFAARMGLMEETAAQREARAAATAAATQARFEQSLALREAAQEDRNKPKFKPSLYPDLGSKVRELEKVLSKPEEVLNEDGTASKVYNYDRAEELASDIEAIAGDIYDEFGEDAANPYFSVVERARGLKEKRVKPIVDAAKSFDYYNIPSNFR